MKLFKYTIKKHEHPKRQDVPCVVTLKGHAYFDTLALALEHVVKRHPDAFDLKIKEQERLDLNANMRKALRALQSRESRGLVCPRWDRGSGGSRAMEALVRRGLACAIQTETMLGYKITSQGIRLAVAILPPLGFPLFPR